MWLVRNIFGLEVKSHLTFAWTSDYPLCSIPWSEQEYLSVVYRINYQLRFDLALNILLDNQFYD